MIRKRCYTFVLACVALSLVVAMLACGQQARQVTSEPVAVGSTLASAEVIQPTTLPPSAPTLVPGDCIDGMQFVADVTVPAGSAFAPNEPFVKTWRVRNCGTVDWVGYRVVFDHGEPMGTLEQPIPDTSIGQDVDISIEMTAPGGAGIYVGVWRVEPSTGSSLGTLACEIVVGDASLPAETATPMPTSLPTAEVSPVEGARASEYAFVRQWGTQGSGDGEFNFPRAIAIGPDGSIYIADSENHRVQVFALDGVFVGQWGGYGSGVGQFDVPQGIAVGPAGDVYVGDRNNSRVQRFTADGTFVSAWGSYGSGPGQFIEPRNLAVDQRGNVYVADSYNHRVQKFSSAGDFLATWGTPGSADGQFNYATGVAVDATTGVVYVCDADNQRVQKLSAEGAFITAWGSEGSGPGQFSRPYSAAVDGAGNVYVVDEWNHRIQKFTADGTFVAVWGGEGSAEGEFNLPHGVAIDAHGLVYVVDEWNHRVQVFREEVSSE